MTVKRVEVLAYAKINLMLDNYPSQAPTATMTCL